MTATLFKSEYLKPDGSLPLVIQPQVKGINPITWAATHKPYIEANLLTHGGLLFRNFGMKTATEFEQFSKVVCGELLEYHERSSPRRQVRGNVYTSTDYPASESIFLHNENSYQQTWPMRILFFCQTAPQSGGETPIADCRKIYQRLSAELRQRFIDRKWMLIRNFGDGLGLPWQTVFQTTDKAVVEEHCRINGIQTEWKGNDRLRTRAVRPAVRYHPETGEPVWFNHATFFHVSTLDPTISAVLTRQFKEEDLPSTTCYGDGSSIEPETLEELREAYRCETVAFPWQEGDLLLLDNMLVAHSRAPYKGPRVILVGMAQSYGG
ncbi:MAG TPA: TauD/TfdA family dioxygenase [Pyrinomonadaceae bacterium]|nr:TauD/TfdA family dioxygenase [Pyrinomonadaceae bacterium]